MIWFEPGRAVCDALGADPWGTLASGTLLAAFPEDLVEAAVGALRARGHGVAVIARAVRGSGVGTEEGRPIARFVPDEVARVLSDIIGT